MRGSRTTNGVEARITARLAYTKLTPIGMSYYWQYDLQIRNLREFPITIVQHTIITHDGISRLNERKEFGIVGGLQPNIEAGRSFVCSKSLETSDNEGIIMGSMRISSRFKSFDILLPSVILETSSSSVTRALN